MLALYTRSSCLRLAHGRHPKSLQDMLRHRCCVPRCVPRSSCDLAKLIDSLRRPATIRIVSAAV